jgi:hypothetical protein
MNEAINTPATRAENTTTSPAPRSQWKQARTLAVGLIVGVLVSVSVAQTAGAVEGPMGQIRLMRELLSLIDDVRKVTDSPSASGVAAVMGVKDQMQSPQAAIDFLERTLPQVQDPSVQRAIRIQLGDLYKNTGQKDKALAQSERLIIGKPGAN